MKIKMIIGLSLSLMLSLMSCSDGDSSSSATQSTPVVSLGTITGFGSVFVNGIKYNTDNAKVFRGDDQVNDVQDLEIGMIVKVEGDLQNETATSVSFEEDIKGPADAPAIGDTISVMGQTVITGPATLFNNTTLNTIAAGDILEVSGLRGANDDIIARFIEKKTVPDNVNRYSVIGNVRSLDTVAKTFNIDGLSIDYNTAILDDFASDNPVEGQLVKVKDDGKTYVEGSFSLTATKVESQNPLGNGVAGTKMEIESIVTQVNSASEFELGALRVRISASTLILFGTVDSIVPGVRIEVEGALDNSGVLLASKVKFEDNQAGIQARVDSVDTTAGTVTLLGIPISITSETKLEDDQDSVSPFLISDILAGDYLEISGFVGTNGVFVATEVKRDQDDNNVEIQGPAETKDAVAGTVTILGLTVNTNTSTEYEGLNDQILEASQFFDAIIDGLTIVEAKWEPFTDVSQAAKEMELED